MPLRLENIMHTYDASAHDERPVIQVENWELRAGDQYLLRGVSGSGKTTLFNIMTGLLRPRCAH